MPYTPASYWWGAGMGALGAGIGAATANRGERFSGAMYGGAIGLGGGMPLVSAHRVLGNVSAGKARLGADKFAKYRGKVWKTALDTEYSSIKANVAGSGRFLWSKLRSNRVTGPFFGG